MADRVHVNPKGSWKKVKISPNLFQESDLDGLISLEELTEYEIVKENKQIDSETLEKKKKEKTQKRKEQTDSAETKDPSSKGIGKVKKKRKKKEKKIKAQSSLQIDATITDDKTNIEETQVTEKITDTQGVKKRKKNKKKDKKSKQVKSGKTLKLKEPSVIDVAEELEKIKSTEEITDEKINKKRKKSETTESSPKKKQKLDRSESSQFVDEAEILKGMEDWKDLFVPVPVLRALKENGFVEPTPIQAQVLPPAIRDRLDILGAAETGSGKTLAFGIPLIHYILEEKKQTRGENNVTATDLLSGQDLVTELETEIDNDSETEQKEDDIALGSDDDVCDKNDDDSVEDISEADNVNDVLVHTEDDDLSNNDAIIDNEDNTFTGSSSEEELENLGDGEKGCVKVIKDVDLSWMSPEMITSVKPTRTHPLGLILEPTRELAIQVQNHLQAAAKYTDISIAVIVGGLSMQKQRRILKRCPDIIVATPGRLWELVQEGEMYLSGIEETKLLVVDEADRMVEKGHFEELSKLLLLMNLDEKLRKQRHTYVFSATLTLLHSGPQRILKTKKKVKLDENQKLELLMKNIGLKDKPKVIDLTRKVGTVETLTEARINCTTEEKDIYLYYFLKQYPGRTLVFTNSKDCIRRLVSIFTLLQCKPLPLHADMHQRQRLKNLDRFSGNPNGLLLASDVAARGLDIPNVEHVIHYQVPHTVENYVHRSGRTARASKEGLSVVLIAPQDMKNYRKIMHSLNKSEDLPMFPVDQEYLSEVKHRVNIVRRIETQEYRFKKKKHQNDWFKKAAEEIGVDIDDENLLNDLGDDVEQARHKQLIKQMKKELDILLRHPIVPHTFGGKYPTKTGKLATIPQKEKEKDAIHQVKKDKKLQDKMKARDSLKPQLSRPMKPKKKKWKKKNKH